LCENELGEFKPLIEFDAYTVKYLDNWIEAVYSRLEARKIRVLAREREPSFESYKTWKWQRL